ncbi:molybdopterin cofactor-binding domain-containing protein [Alteromonas sp. C1M14]|uniref:xanthine dehydrogenase family protein molybdopterin-binding subunit n=1 Tax=Alteromonas sp. C1M14 TaxID=2841567 RepID=UPI001C09311F|nr:molybdopterin cofactor-binding domain-containing protein [Alteromonas sp. C1M14]MBU2977154.1 molybdopterin-dependent oxidoreductase [Alteromonas sp. C1M14]
MSQDTLSRRSFLKATASTGGLSLAVTLLPGKHVFAAQDNSSTPETLTPSVFIDVAVDGTVNITCHRSEMGQQVRTAIAQIIADELDADWQRINVIQATGDKKYGDQNTDGSRSIRRNIDRLQIAGATAALMLRQAAAKGWGISADDCVCDQHTVRDQNSGKKIDFAAIVPVAATLPVPEPETVTPKARSAWKFVGKGVASIDLPAVVKGATVYGQDVQLDNMLVAVIVRPPVLYTTPVSVDDSKAKQVPGVKHIITMPALTEPPLFKPLGGVAVLATHTWAAMQGAKALVIEWSKNEHSQYQFETEKAALIASAQAGGEIIRKKGDAPATIAAADDIIEATYFAPLLAQAPMEPPAATANVVGDKAEIWACTQHPQSARSNVAGILGIPEENVTVNVTLLGGGFGRKSKPDYSNEAALLSQQVNQPVKLIWRREDDIQHGYYHSVSAQHIKAVQDSSGKTLAWQHCTAFPSISSTFAKGVTTPSAGELRLGFTDNPFAIENMQLEKGEAVSHVRIGWLRSVCNIFHAFAIHSFADELAAKAQQDSKAYLLSLIGPGRIIDLASEGAEYDNYGDPIEKFPVDTSRLINVIERVCKLANWDERKKQKRFLGLAAHRSFLSYVATIVEVEVDDDGSWRIPATYISIDAGTIVNTEHVKAQCEGGAIYGLSCALGQISAQDGAITQSNFHNYQVARIQHAPQDITVDIVDSEAPAAGVGEPPTPPFIPALTNAIFAATGVRIRTLPLPSQIKR